MTRAFVAATIATAVLSSLMALNQAYSVLPSLDLLAELQRFNDRLSLPSTVRAAWITHALIGIVVYGAVYGLIEPILPGGPLVKGASFGLIAWLTMMVSFFPLAGHDIFGQDVEPVHFGALLFLHLVYGVVLATTEAALMVQRS